MSVDNNSSNVSEERITAGAAKVVTLDASTIYPLVAPGRPHVTFIVSEVIETSVGELGAVTAFAEPLIPIIRKSAAEAAISENLIRIGEAH
jgi:hypothetical protein